MKKKRYTFSLDICGGWMIFQQCSPIPGGKAFTLQTKMECGRGFRRWAALT